MAQPVDDYYGFQGWRGWKTDVPPIWVDCTWIRCLQKQKRAVGWYEVLWGVLCVGSYVGVKFVGELYYNKTCYPKDKNGENVCDIPLVVYWWLVGISGFVLFFILAGSRLRIPRLKCRNEGSSRFFGLVGTYIELGTVALLGAFLHVHHQSFCWLFIILAVIDMCAMKILVPTYDFKGPAILAQVGIATSLFPGVRKWSFTSGVVASSFGIYLLKTLVDTNWRVVLRKPWVEWLNNHFGILAEELNLEGEELENIGA